MANSSVNNSSPSNEGDESSDCFSPELLVETSMNFSSLPKEIKEELFTSECNGEDDAQTESIDHFMANPPTNGNSSEDNCINQSTSDGIDCPVPNKKPRLKRVAVKPSNRNRKETGEFFTTYKEIKKDRKAFHDYMGMELETFEYILDKLRLRLTKQYTNWNVQPIVPEERLVLFLRYMTVGMSFNSLASAFKLGGSTVNKIITETAEAMWCELQPLHMPVPSALQFKEIADDFEATVGFPHALGIIDGRHVRVKCPDNPESLSQKSNFSVVLHIIAGTRCKILLADVGCYGKCGWDWSFTDTPLYKHIKYLKIPAPTPITNTTIKAPYEFLGADTYPLLNFVLRPYSKHEVGKDPWKSEFNQKFNTTYQTCDRTFQRLFSHWRFMSQPVTTNLTNVGAVMKSACVLHNLLIEREKDYLNIQETAVPMVGFRLRKAGRANLSALDRRNIFGKYFAANHPSLVKSNSS